VSNEPAAALASGLADLDEVWDLACRLRARASLRLDEIRPLLIGRRVERYRRVWQITQVNVSISAGINVGGVTVRKNKIGTRVFDLGLLHNCKLLPMENDYVRSE
jgi:hypothetical protein